MPNSSPSADGGGVKSQTLNRAMPAVILALLAAVVTLFYLLVFAGHAGTGGTTRQGQEHRNVARVVEQLVLGNL